MNTSDVVKLDPLDGWWTWRSPSGERLRSPYREEMEALRRKTCVPDCDGDSSFASNVSPPESTSEATHEHG